MSRPASFWRLDGADLTLLVLPGIDPAARATASSAAGFDAPPGEVARGDAGGVGGGVPRLAYFGPALGAVDDVEALLCLQDTALAFGGQDAPEPLTLCPEASHGYTGSPGLAGHRDGRRFAHRWTLAGARDEGAELVFALVAERSGLALELRLGLDPDTGVLSMRSALTNTGDDDYTVDWLASGTLPVPALHAELLLQHGRWGREFQEAREPIGVGRRDVVNLHGRTSHEHVPLAMTGTRGFGNAAGEVLAAHLAWSGNFSIRVERLSDGTTTLQAGLLPLPGEVRLAPGEVHETPVLHVAHGTAGINACTHRFHAHARLRVLPGFTRTARPIHANSWEALYFDHDLEALLDLVDAAAALGAERFVLDDGWFGRRRADHQGLGDWTVSAEVYPDGLHPVVERVSRHGMRFGLWFEPEMVNPDSALYEAHPEWVLRLDGVETPLARHQLALDIAREDVQDHLVERVVALVREYDIDYVKWDMNRDLVLPGDGERARAAAQPAALYRMLGRIREACPGLEIESCSSGGARADFGVLAHTGRVWTSDNIDPLSRVHIQAGFLRFLPPEIMGAHVGHEHAHLTGRSTGLHTRAVIALQGQFGFELDARRLDAHDTLVLRHYTELYRTHREWLGRATYHRLDTSSDAIVASALVAEDGEIAFVTAIAVRSHPRTRPGHLRLPPLDGERTWRVSLESANADELRRFDRRPPGWLDEPIVTSGELLARVGLPLPVMAPHAALLICCRAAPALEAVSDDADAARAPRDGARAAPIEDIERRAIRGVA